MPTMACTEAQHIDDFPASLIDKDTTDRMTEQKDIYQLLVSIVPSSNINYWYMSFFALSQQLVRKEKQNQAEKVRLNKRLVALRDENIRLLTEIGHCRNNVENLRYGN